MVSQPKCSSCTSCLVFIKSLILIMRHGYLLLEVSMTYISQADINKRIAEHVLWYRYGDGLHGAHLNLSFLDISGLDISFSFLPKACFSEVNASGVYINDSNLELSSFSSCDLSQSVLSNSDFSGASLYGCDLSNSDLSNCLFEGASIFRCNLYKANIYGASFSRDFFVPVLTKGPSENIHYCDYYFSAYQSLSLPDNYYYILSKSAGDLKSEVLNEISDNFLGPLLLKNIDVFTQHHGMMIIERDDFNRLILPLIHRHNSSV